MAMALDIANELTDSTPGFQAAFVRSADARADLRAAELLTINLDIPNIIAVAIGALPRMKTFREAFVKDLPEFDIAAFDALETYADALAYAHTAFLAASEPTTDLPALLERATKMRDQLVSDATALARRGIVDAKRLAELKGGTGYLAIAYDLGALVRLIRERWSEISTKSAIQAFELDEAESLYEQITRAYGERTRQSAAAQADDRQRAYTLFVKAYDQARRAIQYVRWEQGDADKIVPSLYSGRGGRGSSDSKAPANGGQAGGANPPVDPENEPTKPVAPVTPVAPVDPGMPGGSPFDSH